MRTELHNIRSTGGVMTCEKRYNKQDKSNSDGFKPGLKTQKVHIREYYFNISKWVSRLVIIRNHDRQRNLDRNTKENRKTASILLDPLL